MLKLIYTLFLGILLATFVGVGIAAFYPAPKAPDYPVSLTKPAPALTPAVETPADLKAREDYDAAQKNFQTAMNRYSRNVSIAALAASIVMLVISLSMPQALSIISDGLLFGGVLTVLYSVGWGFASDDNKYRFLVVTVGLILAFILGYLKFIHPEKRART